MTDPAENVPLSVRVDGHPVILAAGETFTFGRDSTCTAVLDAMDRGISRIAGALVWENGSWWIVNRSTKRALHVVDAIGLSVPLPVARPGWPPSKRAIDPAGLRVLVAGEVWTHELRVAYLNPPVLSTVARGDDVGTTTTQTPVLTDARRLVLVALLSGYLQPFPRYDPQPLTYAEVADMVGLPKSTVTRRFEAVRRQLRDAGVPGLDNADARRSLAEWLLAMRLITPPDLQWLHQRLSEPKTFQTP